MGFPHAGGRNDLYRHCGDLFGLNDTWNADEADLELTGTQVVIHLSLAGSDLSCPECGVALSRAAAVPHRNWRHLNTIPSYFDHRVSLARADIFKGQLRSIESVA